MEGYGHETAWPEPRLQLLGQKLRMYSAVDGVVDSLLLLTLLGFSKSFIHAGSEHITCSKKIEALRRLFLHRRSQLHFYMFQRDPSFAKTIMGQLWFAHDVAWNQKWSKRTCHVIDNRQGILLKRGNSPKTLLYNQSHSIMATTYKTINYFLLSAYILCRDNHVKCQSAARRNRS